MRAYGSGPRARVVQNSAMPSDAMTLRCWVLAGVVVLMGCAGRAQVHGRTVPGDAQLKRQTVDELARSLYDAFGHGTPERTLIARNELDDLLTPEGRLRAEWWRDKGDFEFARKPWSEIARGSRYVGFCAQGARDEAPGSGVGLREPAWTFGRLLLVSENGNRRSAAWAEGTFVLTDQGFRVLSYTRIEAPRAHHTDLDFAPCDVEQGIR